jgi:hypothetical protein
VCEKSHDSRAVYSAWTMAGSVYARGVDRPLGRLVGEEDEPLTRAAVDALESHMRAEWGAFVTLDRAQARRLIAELRWLDARLGRMEDALLPLVEDLRARGVLPR